MKVFGARVGTLAEGRMTPRRFAWMLRARGPEVSAWPGAEREAALALLQHSPEAADLLAASLTEEDAPRADDGALRRITAPVQRALAPLTPVMRRVRWGVVVVCLCAGLALGVLQAEAEMAPEGFTSEAFAALFASTPATVLAALDQ